MTKLYVPCSMVKLRGNAKQYKTIVVESGKPLLNTDSIYHKLIIGCVFICGMQHFTRILFSLKSQHHAPDHVTLRDDVTTISTK